MFDFGYLEKLVEFLQRRNPYSHIYEGYSTHLHSLVNKLTKLEKEIYKEIDNLKRKKHSG